MKRRAITNEKESKKWLCELEKQHKAEAKWLEKERKKEESRKRKNAATLIRNWLLQNAFNELRNTVRNTMQRISIMNSILNLIDIDANIPLNNHTIFNTVEPNNTSTEINSLTVFNAPTYSNNTSNKIQPPIPNIHEYFKV